MSTSYFCWKCKTKDHWADEVCPKEKLGSEVSPPKGGGLRAVTSAEDVPAPIKKVKAFLKSVGRPRIHPDRKVYMKEYMRRWRERKSARQG